MHNDAPRRLVFWTFWTVKYLDLFTLLAAHPPPPPSPPPPFLSLSLSLFRPPLAILTTANSAKSVIRDLRLLRRSVLHQQSDLLTAIHVELQISGPISVVFFTPTHIRSDSDGYPIELARSKRSYKRYLPPLILHDPPPRRYLFLTYSPYLRLVIVNEERDVRKSLSVQVSRMTVHETRDILIPRLSSHPFRNYLPYIHLEIIFHISKFEGFWTNVNVG